jgi:phenylglyoxylate dehydrogenase gamma subunit
MQEVRIHGRGGQGAVLALKLLAKALVAEGKFALGVPSFGFERRGAPVTAFLRIDEHDIRMLTNIYDPDFVLCIDPTLANAVNIFAGMREGGMLVQATKLHPSEVQVPPCVGQVGVCDAVGISLEVFGKAITNTVMLGAFAKASGVVSLDSLVAAVISSNMFRDAAAEANVIAVRRGYDETVIAPRSKESLS